MRRVCLVMFLSACLEAAVPGWTGSAVCATCHRRIYQSYMRTPMARSSGAVGTGLIQEAFENASFSHASSGFEYRVSREAERYSLKFGKKTGELSGAKALKYFVGSGVAARSYLI